MPQIFLKKRLYFFWALFMLSTLPITAQETSSAHEWLVVDKDMSKVFIEEYHEHFFNLFPQAEEYPRTNHKLIVNVDDPYE